MEATDYQLRADECLKRIANWLEDFDPDEVDFEEADGVIKLLFSDGKTYVLNRQAGSSQMWFAAEARAWHYDWSPQQGTWVDDRDGHDLYENVGAVVSKKIGREVRVA